MLLPVRPSLGDVPGHHEALSEARALVAGSRSIVALTGAGISTDSGIPDFRGPSGVWTKDPSAERLATLQAYVEDPEVRRRAWGARLDSPTWSARPNPGHRALVDLERAGRLDTVVTQNIDGLHQAAGQDPARVIEIHGTMREVVCLACGDRQPAEGVLDRVRNGERDPTCRAVDTNGAVCAGMLKSATISFGQQLVPADVTRAQRAAAGCDLMVAVGSTLTVYPAADLVPLSVSHGAALIIVNADPTGYDDLADVVLRGPISELLPSIVADAAI